MEEYYYINNGFITFKNKLESFKKLLHEESQLLTSMKNLITVSSYVLQLPLICFLNDEFVNFTN